MLCDFCTVSGAVGAETGWLGGLTRKRFCPWPVVAQRGWHSSGQAIFRISASRLWALLLRPGRNGRTRMSSSLTRLPKLLAPRDRGLSLAGLALEGDAPSGGEGGRLQFRQTSGSGVAAVVADLLLLLNVGLLVR
jgi:hypothetical protein